VTHTLGPLPTVRVGYATTRKKSLHSSAAPADGLDVASRPVPARRPSRGSRFSALAALVLLAAPACATFPGLRSGPSANLDGVWEGYAQGTINEGLGAGDTRIERQAWHLRQDGDRVSGYYLVELTMISGDGRPYACSREPQFQTVLRFQIEGAVRDSGIELAEVGDGVAEGPCRPAFRTAARFRAEIAGDKLMLADGNYQLTLYRRGSNSNAAPAAKPAAPPKPVPAPRRNDSDDDDGAPPPSNETLTTVNASLVAPPLPPVEVGGVWVWEHRARLPTGDEKQEREEWHLDQQGSQLSGYYDRSIRQISTDGLAYRCSNATDFRVTTRYHVSGQVVGNRVKLREQSFEILQGSPCDSGERRLDAYQGEAAIDELRLLWGVGSQVLRRDRPEIPSQRF
jgi:hypothetical protein